MELLQRPEIKSTYDKCKLKVKYWEHKFKKKHGRLPSKLDIREADNEIRYAYKTYFNLKSAALEQSFQDIEGFHSDEETPDSTLTTPNISNINSNGDFNTSNTNNETSNKIQDTSEAQNETSTLNTSLGVEMQNSPKVWGTHLNNSTNTERKEDREASMNVNTSFTQKLFKNSSFSKRNPRKSLSFHHRKSETTLNTSKSLSQPEPSSATSAENEDSEPINFFNGGHLKIASVIEPAESKSLNAVQSVLDERFRTSRKIDAGWMQRVAAIAGTRMVNKNINENNFALSQKMNEAGSDSEDIIDDSDEDNSMMHLAKRPRVEGSATQNSQQAVDFRNAFNLPQKNADRQSFAGAFDTNAEIQTEKMEVEEEVKEAPSENPNVIEEIHEKKRKAAPKKRKQTEQKDPMPVRKTTRRTKKLVELPPESEAEDPFDDPESADPEYNPVDEKSKIYNFDDYDGDCDTKESSVKPVKQKVVKKKERAVRTKPGGENKTTDEEENAPYELEFSVKPRIKTVPRDPNLTNVIKKAVVRRTTTKKKVEGGGEGVKSKNDADLKKLKKKVEAGNLNDNFVRIDLKKKVYVRGKKTMNFSKYRKKMWKQHKKNNALAGPEMDMGGCDGGVLRCFNCGQIGHFARNCQAEKQCDKLLPLEAADQEYSPFPTLEEASQMAQESNLRVRVPIVKSSNGGGDVAESSDGENSGTDADNGDKQEEPNSDDELLAEALKLEEYVKKIDMQEYIDSTRRVRPYYGLGEDGKVKDTPPEVFEALQMFGHSSFRPGQEVAIMRILSGQSTLVTLSTGSGKSLCYQLPAYLYAKREPCISLIISPLVSLMEDQVTGIPAFLKAACLHTNKTKVQREKILEAIGSGSLDVLLVSPEAVAAGEKSTGFGSLLRKLPPVAFACIDEAHCVSQWSHNFRPSYLMICRILKERLGIHTILGLTATATRATSDSIIEHLSIPDGRDGIISDTPLPDNLRLTVSKDGNRDHALLGLLLSERFQDLKSVIVYCTRRQECERIASFLRTSLKHEKPTETNSKKRKKTHVQAEPYHAGLSASRRRTIQKNFMSGDLRIVVATVAFGMGINKSDIRAVIHYNLPRNFESYVQEVGRAGRDGLPAHCHLFLDPRGGDENELQRHIYSDSIDRHVIRKLLQKIFIPCSCKTICPKHEVAFSIQETVNLLDIPEENISTLLCYLELRDERYIEVLSPSYVTCKVIAYGGANIIRKAAKDCPPLAMALVMFGNKEVMENTFEFPVVEVAAAMGWDSGICKHKLKNLEWTNENNQPRRSFITVQFVNLGFRVLAAGNLSDSQLDESLDLLYNRVVEQEKTALLQLHSLHDTVTSVANQTYRTCISDKVDEKEIKLKAKIREYFDSPHPLTLIEVKEKACDENLVANDVRAIVSMYRDNSFTGRAIARIFYGIPSPNYPAVIWGRCKFWRMHINTDFNAICKIATREILRLR